MPVGAKAISPAIMSAQYKPGKSRGAKGDQIPESGFAENPAKGVKKHQAGMKSEEKIIQQREGQMLNIHRRKIKSDRNLMLFDDQQLVDFFGY